MTEIIVTTTKEERQKVGLMLLRFVLDSNSQAGDELRARMAGQTGDNADQREAIKWALERIGEGK